MVHATGVLHAEKISFLEDNKIPLSLKSDGSNVNKTVWNKLDEQISSLPEREWKVLVNISTSNLHACHNAFQNGLQVASLSLQWVSINGSRWLLPDLKTMKKCQESMAFRLIIFDTWWIEMAHFGPSLVVNCGTVWWF